VSILRLRKCTVRCRWGSDLWGGEDPLRSAEQDGPVNKHYSLGPLAGDTIMGVRSRVKSKTMSLGILYLRLSMLVELYAVIADIRTWRLSQTISRASMIESFGSRYRGREQGSELSHPARSIPRGGIEISSI
jgi:hypothetical protein